MGTADRLKRYLVQRYLTGRRGSSSGSSPNILESYVTSVPSPQNALDIFKGEWASHLPPPFAELHSGPLPLFDDPRISGFLSDIGGVTGKTVLELGPLEAGHSYMLDRAGAAHVTAVEANSRAFLKCLIVKELVGLPKVHFLCGDFMAYLRQPVGPFDVCVASGVLYHMQNPAELIQLLAERCREHLFLWTHYYDRDLIEKSGTAHKYPSQRRQSHNGFEHVLYVHEYQRALDQQSFCGGSAPTSCWMTKDDILRCLEFFGFQTIKTVRDHTDHPNGPAVTLYATRATG
jgi:SAM-dependent methyltransferase